MFKLARRPFRMDDDDDMPNIDPPSRGATPLPRDSSGSAAAPSSRPATADARQSEASARGRASRRASEPRSGATPRSSASALPGGGEDDGDEAVLRASVASLSLAPARDSEAHGGRPSTAGRSSSSSSAWAREVVDELLTQAVCEAGEDGIGDGNENDGADCSSAADWSFVCDTAVDELAAQVAAEEDGGSDCAEPQLGRSRAAPLRNATPRRSVHGSFLLTPSRYAGGSDADDAATPRSSRASGFGAPRYSAGGARSSLGGGDSSMSLSYRLRDLDAIADAGIAAAAARAAAAKQRAATAASELSDAERYVPASLHNSGAMRRDALPLQRARGCADAARGARRSDESFCVGDPGAFGGARTPRSSGSAALLPRGGAPSPRRPAAALSPTRSPGLATMDEPRGLLPEARGLHSSQALTRQPARSAAACAC